VHVLGPARCQAGGDGSRSHPALPGTSLCRQSGFGGCACFFFGLGFFFFGFILFFFFSPSFLKMYIAFVCNFFMFIFLFLIFTTDRIDMEVLAGAWELAGSLGSNNERGRPVSQTTRCREPSRSGQGPGVAPSLCGDLRPPCAVAGDSSGQQLCRVRCTGGVPGKRPSRAGGCLLLVILELVLAAIISNYKSGASSCPALPGDGCAWAAAGPWALLCPGELKAWPSRVPEHQLLSRWAEHPLGQFRSSSRWQRGGKIKRKTPPLVSV